MELFSDSTNWCSAYPDGGGKNGPTNVTLTFSAGSIEFGTRYSISASAIFDMSEQVNEIDSTPGSVAMYYVNMLSIDESTMWRFESSGYNYSNAWYRS